MWLTFYFYRISCKTVCCNFSRGGASRGGAGDLLQRPQLSTVLTRIAREALRTAAVSESWGRVGATQAEGKPRNCSHLTDL